MLVWGMVGALTAIGVAVGASSEEPQNTDNRVVVIHADGQEITVSTELTTVKEVLDRAQVRVSNYDAIEPSLDTKIETNVFNINIYRARPVTVVDGAQTYNVMSPHDSPRLIAKSAGVEVYDEDRFVVERIDQDILEAGTLGQKVTIKRSVPVTFVLYGEVIKLRTAASTVGEFLADQAINLNGQDQVQPGQAAPIDEGMVLAVNRAGVSVVSRTELIPAPVETIRDSNMPLGKQVIEQVGQPGRRVVLYQIDSTTNPPKKYSLQRVVLQQPVKQIVRVGTQVDSSDVATGVWAQLRACEAGGDYTRNSGNGYYGAYQFLPSTWDAVAPPDYVGVRPDLAPAPIQDIAAQNLQRGSGWGQWPACSANLGLL